MTAGLRPATVITGPIRRGPDVPPELSDVDKLIGSIEMLLAHVEQLAPVIEMPPPPPLVIEPPDLSAIVTAVNGLKPGADADTIAQAIVSKLNVPLPDQNNALVLEKVADALRNLEFRMQAPNAVVGGGIMHLDPNAAVTANQGTPGAQPWPVTLTTEPTIDIGKVDQGTAGVQAWLVDGSAHTQPVSGAVTVSGSVGVSNFPASQTVTQATGTNLHTVVDNFPATQPVSGTVSVSNFPATQPVSGAVSVSNFPATQPVSGAVAVSNFPSSQAVTGTFFQATQPVSGTFFQATQPVSGTVTATPPALPTTPLDGTRTVAVTNTAVSLGAGTAVNGFVVQALAANVGIVKVGGATPNFELQAGQATGIACGNLANIFVNGTSGDGVCWVGT